MEKEMMNIEQGISNVEGQVRVLCLHHSIFLIQYSSFNGLTTGIVISPKNEGDVFTVGN